MIIRPWLVREIEGEPRSAAPSCNWRRSWELKVVQPVVKLGELTVAAGEIKDIAGFSDLQRTIFPVVSFHDGQLEPLGSAVCIGATGWFLTARHVVEGHISKYRDVVDGSAGLYILWETDERTIGGPTSYLGAPLPVIYAHPHGDVDLVSLTVGVHATTPARLRVATLSLRTPEVGEPVAVVGFSHMRLSGEVLAGQRSSMDYERTLSVGAGKVLEVQHERLGSSMRRFPGLVTDAPIKPGMSGGPVFDQSGEVIGFNSSSLPPTLADPAWNSYVVLAGPALELDVMASEHDGDAPSQFLIANLVADGAVSCMAYESIDVDATTGKVVFLPQPKA